MKSDAIKVIVLEAKAMLAGDRDPRPVMVLMCRDMRRSTTFAVAITLHLLDQGVDLLAVDGQEGDLFRDTFGRHVERVTPETRGQIQRISSKLFA